jgi:hypothetical protein
VENTFGPCAKPGAMQPQPGSLPEEAHRRLPYHFVYARIGLAVFFEESEDRVQSFVYTPPKGASPAPAGAR